MAQRGPSRNGPCPCGSGKKFKHCCLSKGIDWDARKASGLAGVLPRPRRGRPPSADFVNLDPFGVVDSRLREVAQASRQAGEWQRRVEGLSALTPDRDRLEAYRLVRQAAVLPDDAAGFLFGHTIQWLPSAEGDWDRFTLAVLRRHGQADLADLYAKDRLEYDRRYERGRQFFFGPPDEELAEHLRQKGVID